MCESERLPEQTVLPTIIILDKSHYREITNRWTQHSRAPCPVLSFFGCCAPKCTAGGAVPYFTLLCLRTAVRSRDASVRGQHGGHACGVPKQIASIVQLTPPRETSIPSREPVRRCPSRQQNGRRQQTAVPVPALDKGGPFGKCTTACVSRFVCPARLSYNTLQPHCPTADICALLESLCFGA